MLRIIHAIAVLFILVTGLAAAQPASADSSPAMRVTDKNTVPACVTPARLMRMVMGKNAALDAEYFAVAEQYRIHGEALGLRWDYAFFQILYETNWLRSVSGYNLARFGNHISNGELETFPDLSSGVLAHLQHLQMHSGTRVEEPKAQRTREVQDEMLPKAQLISNKRPVTFLDLAKRWAPGSRKYYPAIDKIAASYRKANCKANGKPVGAEPEALAVAAVEPAAEPSSEPAAEPSSEPASEEVAASASSEAPEVETAEVAEEPVVAKVEKPKPSVSAAQQKIDDELAALEANGKVKSIEIPETADDVVEKASVKSEADVGDEAAAGATATAKKKVDVAKIAKQPVCKVFTASYGGAKSLLIKSKDGGLTTYTALAVHEGKEDAQARAYIDAYAKDGSAIGSYGSQKEALVKAFELCPEG